MIILPQKPQKTAEKLVQFVGGQIKNHKPQITIHDSQITIHNLRFSKKKSAVSVGKKNAVIILPQKPQKPAEKLVQLIGG